MEYNFIIDTQLPPSLSEFFRRKGFNASHVMDYPNGALTSDGEIIKIAINEVMIIVTKDNDFINNYLINGCPPKVLLLQLGNIKNGELFLLLNKHLNYIIDLYSIHSANIIYIRRERIFYF